MNLKVDEIDFNAFEKLANFIRDYKIEHLWGDSMNDYQIKICNQDAYSIEMPIETIKKLLDLKNELKVYWVDSNSSSVFFTLGRWVDASWGITKVYDAEFHSPFKNGEIHEWEKIGNKDWYYFLHE